MAVTIDTFLKRLSDSGILDPAALEDVRAEAKREQDRKNAEPFVKRLHKSGRVTGYQIQALWKNKGRKLSLGNYVIEDELGRGGMGVVLKARHRRMQRLVAVKVLPSKMTKDKDAIARFEREVVAAAQLAHTNIVAAHDADEIDGQHILVMEFVDGRDLSSVVRKQGPLSVEQALDCTIQAARGLEFAHQKGVVHRDIKPANLLLDKAGTVKILDMGLARFADSADVGTQAELTGTGTVMGTVDYMSPEQAMSTKTADGRSDQYSLGITLWFLLTGEPAFTGDSLMARLMAHANEPIPDLRTKRPDVADNLQAVFARMVAKKSEERYASMTEAIADLATCRTDTSGTAVVATAPVTGESPSGIGEGGLTGFLNSLESDAGSSSPSVTQPATAVKRKKKQKPAATSPAEEATLVASPTSGTVKTAAWTTNPAHSKLPPFLTDWRTLAGAAACLLLLGAVFFLFRTPNGTLRIEIDDPEIEVSIKGTDIVLKGADTQDVTLSPGEKTLHVTRGDFSFDTTSLILKKGETIVVKVELLDGELRAMRDGKVIGSRTGEPPPLATPPGNESSTNFALAFDGVDDHVAIPSLRYDDDAPLTIEATVKDVAKFGQILRGYGRLRGPSLFLHDGAPRFHFHGHDESWLADSTFTLSGTHRIACTWDGDVGRLYVDGREVAVSQHANYRVDWTDGGFLIGSSLLSAKHNQSFLSGIVDEVRISSTVRYRSNHEPVDRLEPDADTLALYHFDEGTGDVLKDSSGNGHDGKITGAKWVRANGSALPAGNSVQGPPVAEWSEWRPIFDGESLDGWELFGGEPGDWKVFDGVLTGSGKGNKLVYTRERFDDVSVRLECRLSPQTNSGLYLRSGANAKADDGYEVQLAVPTARGASEKLQTGAVWRFSESTEQLVRAGEWFPVEVEARGRRIRVEVDGRTTADFEDDTFDVGHVALQGLNTGHPIEVRAIAVREPSAAWWKGAGLRFDGIDDHVGLPRIEWDGGPFTVEAVVQAGAQAFPNGTIVALNPGSGLAMLSLDPAGVPAFGRMVGQELQSTVDSATRNRAAARPTHVAVVWDGKEATLYLDGKRAARGVGGTYAARGLYGPQAIIGAVLQGAAGEEAPMNFLKGSLHELRLSSVARYSADYDPVDRFQADEQTLALYHFDGGRGDVLKDSSGHGHHGRIVGATWVSVGVNEPASGAVLDLSNKGHVALPVKLSGETPVTVEMWVTPRHVADDHVSRRLWEAGAIELKQFGGNWDLAGVNRPGVEVADRLVSSRGTCVAGRRTHLVAVLTGEELALFVDGKLAGRKAYAALPDSNRPMFLGSPSYDDGDSGYQPFDGTFDEVRLSHGVRYTEDFEPPDHFEADDRTWLLYHCDEGTGDVLKDSSGNGYHGTIVGATWVRGDGPPETSTASLPPAVAGADNALQFRGATTFVECPDVELDNAIPHTMEAWVRVAEPWGNVLSWSNRTFPRLVMGGFEPPGVIMEQQNYKGPRTRGGLPNGWVHIAGVQTPEKCQLFIDGQLARESDTPILPDGAEHSKGLRIGGPIRFFRELNGELDEVRLSSVARYSGEFTPERRFERDEHTVALYHCDEGTGDVLKDSSGNGHDGTIVGAKWVRAAGDGTEGFAGEYALEFDGVGDGVELAKLRYDGGTATIELWMEIGEKEDPNQPIMMLHGDGARTRLSLYGQSAVSSIVDVEGARNIASLTTTAAPRVLHLAVVWKDRVGTLFVDGVRDAATTTDRATAALAAEMPSYIGGSLDDPQKRSFRGRIYEVRVSTTARYEEDFTPRHRFEPDEHTLALYHFDEGTGDVLKDSSGHGHDGKIVGAKWVRVGGKPILGAPPSARIDLLREHPLTGGGSATKQADGTWKSWTGGQIESSRPVAGDYRVELVFVQSGGFDADLGLVLPVGGTQVELIVPDQVRGQSQPSRLELVDGKSLATKPVSFGKGQVENLLTAEVRHEGGRWRISGSFGDVELIDRVFDEAQLSLTPSRRFSRAGHIGVHLSKMAVDIKSLTLVVPDDGSTAPVGDAPQPAVAPFDAAAAKADQAAWAKHLGEPVVTTNSIGMKLAVIPPGKFTMGEGDGAVPVTLTRPFRLGVHEVTQGQWRAVMGTEPWKGLENVLAGENVAASYTSWTEATEFCRRLTETARKAGKLSDDWEYRLPTEAEWEWACRAGTTTAYAYGDDESQLGEYAWYVANAKDAGEHYPHEVGSKQPNPWGLHDVQGNVWEWCHDRAGEHLPGGNDPIGVEGSNRVSKGGSWHSTAERCRAVLRSAGVPSQRLHFVGFRLALGPTGKADEVGQSMPRSTTPPRPAVSPFDAAAANAHQEAWAKHLGVPVEFTNKIGMTFVLVPPGEFLMGADPEAIDAARLEAMSPNEAQREAFVRHAKLASPRHRVTITRPFYVQTHEVTGENFRRVIGKVPEGNPANGVVKKNVGLPEAVAFCNALSKIESRPPAYRTGTGPPSRILDSTGYRLPTEAEWEYASRAGTTTTWYFGDDPHGPRGRLSSLQDQQTGQRGKFAKPNPFGLFDVYAGSSEWCFDRFEKYGAEDAVDPFTEPGDSHGVLRGSSSFAGGGGDLSSVNGFYRETINEGGPKWCGLGRLVLPIPYTPPIPSTDAGTTVPAPSAGFSTTHAVVVPLVELNRSDYNMAPWPSRDGLRLYWEGHDDAGAWPGTKTVMAARPDANSPFGKPRVVADGRMPTLSPDELELICVPGAVNKLLHVTQRRSIDVPFPKISPLEIPSALGNPKCPALSPDGLRLFVQDGTPDKTELRTWSRTAPDSGWKESQPLGGMHERDHALAITWPFLSDDGLRVWYGHGGNRETQIWTGTRGSIDEPFGHFAPVEIDGRVLVGKSARYVPATRELFFSRPVGEGGWELAVVRNYTPGE